MSDWTKDKSPEEFVRLEPKLPICEPLCADQSGNLVYEDDKVVCDV